MQNTWKELLGLDSSNCEVDAFCIIRRLRNSRQCRILWSFETHEQAKACFNRWMEELEPLHKESV